MKKLDPILVSVIANRYDAICSGDWGDHVPNLSVSDF